VLHANPFVRTWRLLEIGADPTGQRRTARAAGAFSPAAAAATQSGNYRNTDSTTADRAWLAKLRQYAPQPVRDNLLSRVNIERSRRTRNFSLCVPSHRQTRRCMGVLPRRATRIALLIHVKWRAREKHSLVR
jgi:hypothetical protein